MKEVAWNDVFNASSSRYHLVFSRNQVIWLFEIVLVISILFCLTITIQLKLVTIIRVDKTRRLPIDIAPSIYSIYLS